MLIAEKHTEEDPIILSGCGPQVRVYTIHGSRAIDNLNGNETPLMLQASESWRLSLPAKGDDLALVQRAVRGLDHVEVYEPGDEASADNTANRRQANSGHINVDLTALEN